MDVDQTDDETADLDPGRAEWRRLAAEFVDRLMASPDEETLLWRLRAVAREEPCNVSRALLAEARSCARTDPHRAVTLARYGVLAAEEIDPALHSSSRTSALLASAFCRLAQAYRLAGRLEDAETAFRRASSYLPTLSLDAFDVSSLYLSLLAELRDDQGRSEEAEELRRQADVLVENLA
jgi:tetratricopeptide (TPR) repeat protein